jgi:hypothetical protein
MELYPRFQYSRSSKKSLKIPKGYSESVNRRRTDNTMAKRKRTKDKQRSTKQTHKTKDRVTQTPLKPGVNSGALEG